MDDFKRQQQNLKMNPHFRVKNEKLNEKLSWADHTEFVRKKVNQRLGVLSRIKHFLPFYVHNLFVNTMVLPFLDYCDIVWGDRNNKLLMDSIQVLQKRAAKIVLNRPVYSSSTQALLDLKWKELHVRWHIHTVGLFMFLNV